VLLLRLPLGAVGVALDLTCLLGVCRANPWWFICRNHQDVPPDGTLVVGRDTGPDRLELAHV
jgi:hypothetical protein